MSGKDAYSESFADRGSQYDKAMRRVPDSREQEFMAVVEELPGSSGGVVFDVPAGGGYLRRYLPDRFSYKSYEPVASFKGKAKNKPESALIPLPQNSTAFDFVVSVAGIHHFQSKDELYREMARVTRPGGRLVLADVHKHSRVASFLDGYIDASNSTGHQGYYLDGQTLTELESCGWRVLSAQRKRYHWLFKSEQQMAEFCHQLFDIRHSDLSRTRSRIVEELGVDRLDGGVGMRWELFVIVAEKNTTE